MSIKSHVFLLNCPFLKLLWKTPAKCLKWNLLPSICRVVKVNMPDKGSLSHHIYITSNQFTQLTDGYVYTAVQGIVNNCERFAGQKQIQVERTRWLSISNGRLFSFTMNAMNHHFLKEYFNMLGNTLISFIAKTWTRRLIPLTHNISQKVELIL